ncbi:hypothetical protein ACROYT_G018536 [Oculina patagonica]
MMFQEHTTTDYAVKENSIVYDLDATSVCFLVKDTDDNKPSGYEQCLYSYRAPGAENALNILTTPTLRALLNGHKGDSSVAIDYGKWNHICFTWSSANGDYKFYKDGMLVGSGSGLNKGGKISSGGTTVIGQDQDSLGGGFVAQQSFVGEVTEVNVWNSVLSESDIVAQSRNCHVTHGSVNWWSQFKDSVHGGVVVQEP